MRVTKKQRSIIISIVFLCIFSIYSYLTTGSIPAYTELFSPTVTPKPSDVLSRSSSASDSALVTRIIDGDTIEINNSVKLRYIGIDTPESVDPRRELECFGLEASTRNRELVLGKEVRLEKDVSETDRYGRLLRYVYVDDQMINEVLVSEGYAQASAYPPDILYQDVLDRAEKQARIANVGMWQSCLE